MFVLICNTIHKSGAKMKLAFLSFCVRLCLYLFVILYISLAQNETSIPVFLCAFVFVFICNTIHKFGAKMKLAFLSFCVRLCLYYL